MGDRETPRPSAPLFICFFLPLGLLYVNWASQECCLFHLRSSLQSLDLPLFYFSRLFSSRLLGWHALTPLGCIFLYFLNKTEL